MQGKLKFITDHTTFEVVVMSIIIASALSFGVRTFALDPPVMAVINAFDYFVTIFFAIEVLLRFLAEPSKRDFLGNGGISSILL